MTIQRVELGENAADLFSSLLTLPNRVTITQPLTVGQPAMQRDLLQQLPDFFDVRRTIALTNGEVDVVLLLVEQHSHRDNQWDQQRQGNRKQTLRDTQTAPHCRIAARVLRLVW